MSDRVRLMYHDPHWKQEFEQTRSSILMACEGWVTDIAHIGSTAIEGLVARPVIDLAARVSDGKGLPIAQSCIEGLNFRSEPPPDWAEGVIHLIKPRRGAPTHRCFLMQANDPLWNQLQQVTQWIRQSAETQLRFETAKVHQWKVREGDLAGYDRSKSIFFAHVLEQLGY